jgi:gliding-associated putative ABC transporter substrate-binding component GldG
MRKKLQFSAGSMTTVVLVGAVLVVINLLGLAIFHRWDLTEGKIHSLSDFSKQVVRNLNDVLLIKLYFTEDLPAPYNANARYIKDQLNEYKAYSHGKLDIEIIDPVKDQKEDEARGLGIPAVQVNAIEKDKIELKRVYMGLAVLYEDKREVLPLVQSTANLEYDITSAIKKITADSMITIGVLAGQGEALLDTDLQTAQQLLGRQYRVRTVTITPGQLIDPDIRTLLVIGPTNSFTPFELYALDQFIMGGGKVGWMVDGVQTDMATQQATDLVTNVDTLLASYGIKVNHDLVIDTRNSRIGVVQRQGAISFQNIVEYPFFPEAVTFSEDNLITKDLGALTFPFVSSLDTTLADSLGPILRPIVYSSDRSGRKREPYLIQPMQRFTLDDFYEAYIPLAATLVGSFESYFNNHPLPDSGMAGLPEPIRRSPISRMVVVGDSDFMRDRWAANRESNNMPFFLNIVDWLSQDEGLIAIRSRESTSRPIDPNISDGARWRYKYANILGPPILIIIVGLVRWRIRRSKRQKLAGPWRR